MKKILLLIIASTLINICLQATPTSKSVDTTILYPISFQHLKDSLSSSKYTLVCFNATWCKPCLDKINSIIDMEKRFKEIITVVYIWDNRLSRKIILKLPEMNKCYYLDNSYNKSIRNNHRRASAEFNKEFNINSGIGTGRLVIFSPTKKIVLSPPLETRLAEVENFLNNRIIHDKINKPGVENL